MANITYIFTENRRSNYKEGKIQAKEFYYGLTSFDPKHHNIEIIEFDNAKKFLNLPLQVFDEFLRRFISLPFYSAKLFTLKNIKILSKTDHLIIVPESAGCSSLPLLIFLKRFFKFKVHLFVMGLYSKKIRYPVFKRVHYALIKLLVFYLDNVFFLGKEEYEKAKLFHGNIPKLSYFPFSIDTEFWNDKDINLQENNQIIFVGNDGNRDQELIINIIKEMREYNFLIVSQLPALQNLNLNNVKVYSGKWGSNEITDNDLKKIYRRSRLCILPLKNSTQPSGQSVSLQCMSIGVPVLISKTDGFWDYDLFKDNKNIFFSDNSLETWIENIKNLYGNTDLLNKISEASFDTVNESLSLEKFNKKLHNYIDL